MSRNSSAVLQRGAKLTTLLAFLQHNHISGYYHEYALFGGGTAIRLFCRDCKNAFLALPVSQQAFYIRSRCDLAFPRGQVIYGLRDTEVRYIGRTSDQKKRMQKHLQDRYEVTTAVGDGTYYGKANWMHDLHLKGLRPTMEVLREVEIAPQAIEWETRYILHGLQQRWPLTNHEISIESLVTTAVGKKIDLLTHELFSAWCSAGE